MRTRHGAPGPSILLTTARIPTTTTAYHHHRPALDLKPPPPPHPTRARTPRRALADGEAHGSDQSRPFSISADADADARTAHAVQRSARPRRRHATQHYGALTMRPRAPASTALSPPTCARLGAHYMRPPGPNNLRPPSLPPARLPISIPMTTARHMCTNSLRHSTHISAPPRLASHRIASHCFRSRWSASVSASGGVGGGGGGRLAISWARARARASQSYYPHTSITSARPACALHCLLFLRPAPTRPPPRASASVVLSPSPSPSPSPPPSPSPSPSPPPPPSRLDSGLTGPSLYFLCRFLCLVDWCVSLFLWCQNAETRLNLPQLAHCTTRTHTPGPRPQQPDPTRPNPS
ncbi:hypothetical protein B0H15DRAFT_1016808 [Mycena belliarum]|uniref:Uncharacterized protein n=1 Tax=Mycena belliarum TaxID=1033014 RepID=A0AAD6UL19_9AGAR|nr:hypothetical protein B0H15DRAFT_1016808 [Mycena belliae]